MPPRKPLILGETRFKPLFFVGGRKVPQKEKEAVYERGIKKNIYKSATAKSDILESNCGDDFRFPRVGVIGDVAQPLPDIKHVSRDIHTAYRLCDNALLDEKALDAIREVARHRVAIAPIKVGNKNGAT